MTMFQPLQKIHKLYLGNLDSKFVEITCSKYSATSLQQPPMGLQKRLLLGVDRYG